ncbi:hypothetical protein GCM10009037_30860 [Halarchaeum grantii]|uniref:Uncharacterized protein n=1 Tax=Halarchaeum grantii TaxID=1193105 RepID=A0A830F715_9EURY|nr:hypothetical protein [Halarchaeum grantii]GGL45264.1 hypothetical protein GCM10009037_30860 [Halarchaeum grantii]
MQALPKSQLLRFIERENHLSVSTINTMNTMTTRRLSFVRGVSAVIGTAFLGVLGWYLFQPGYSWTRLALFVGLGALAVIGTAGVWYQRTRVVAVGATGLFLLGVSLAVTLWMFILPVVAVLVAATVILRIDNQPNTPSPG